MRKRRVNQGLTGILAAAMLFGSVVMPLNVLAEDVLEATEEMVIEEVLTEEITLAQQEDVRESMLGEEAFLMSGEIEAAVQPETNWLTDSIGWLGSVIYVLETQQPFWFDTREGLAWAQLTMQEWEDILEAHRASGALELVVEPHMVDRLQALYNYMDVQWHINSIYQEMNHVALSASETAVINNRITHIVEGMSSLALPQEADFIGLWLEYARETLTIIEEGNYDLHDADSPLSLTNKLVTIAEMDYKESDYSADSWRALQDAIAHAEAVVNNPFATQSEMENALNVLAAAEKALVKVTTDTESNASTQAVATGTTAKVTAPNTGDVANTIMYGGFAFLAGGVIVVLAIRKKRAHNL